MTIRSRAYEDEDLPLLHEALARWRQGAGSCGYCHTGGLTHRIYEETHGWGERRDLVRVWEGDAGIDGVAVCLRFGTAFDVFTSPALRGSEAEREMLREAYELTRRRLREGGEGWVVTDVFDCDDVRARMLAELGFERYRLFDHVTARGLADAIPEPKLPEGFTIRRAVPGDAGQLATTRNSAFETAWSGEDYHELMGEPAYSGRPERVVVAPDGRIAAFTLVWLDPVNRVGLFEPVGTHADYRRRGLARAVMLYGLAEMRRSGMETAMVEHDATNVPARELYRGLGFTKRHETYGFRRS